MDVSLQNGIIYAFKERRIKKIKGANVPKLLEISMTSGTFQVGERVRAKVTGAGNVTWQYPKGGDLLGKGTGLHLTISLGVPPNFFQVPTLFLRFIFRLKV